jgi:hypothetical protein
MKKKERLFDIRTHEVDEMIRQRWKRELFMVRNSPRIILNTFQDNIYVLAKGQIHPPILPSVHAIPGIGFTCSSPFACFKVG